VGGPPIGFGLGDLWGRPWARVRLRAGSVPRTKVGGGRGRMRLGFEGLAQYFGLGHVRVTCLGGPAKAFFVRGNSLVWKRERW
jgi:hypothetical protein